ncbi:MAG: hypothetical protein KF774_20885 [Planctomyces sp.]|nr:hypothetical protein [Planctomyces sp.]
MARIISAGFLLATALGLSGCQCCQVTEALADVADAVSAHECAADDLYHPGLDLTRIGRRDWCECGINHWLCPCRCDTVCPPGNCR